MASTPSPATIRTPSTPLHGPRYDSPPHHSLRKSSRLTKQPVSGRTPSPIATASFDSEGPGELKRTPKSRRSGTQLSPPSSPVNPDHMVATTRAGAKKQAQAHGLVPQASNDLLALGLPTPVKTPRKKPLQSTGVAARILFPGQQRPNAEEQLMTPSKRNKRIKKHVGFSLDEDLENGNGEIEIYTDNRERIPEADVREDNPFYVKDSSQKASKKRKRMLTGNPQIEERLQEAVQDMDNDEGMVYVFRGKRFYKRFDGPNPATRGGRDGSQSPLHAYSTVGDEQMLEEVDAVEDDGESRRHFTRSSIKPRRLFNHEPEEVKHQGTTTDEEAVTDIEDPERHGLASKSVSRKGKAPARKAAIIEDASRSFEAPPSPFDHWPRRKSARESTGTKREGETLQSGAKRARET